MTSGAHAAIRHPLFAVLLLALWPLSPRDGLRAQTDPRGDVRTWHSAHFRVHARREHAAIALVAVAEAERAYAALETELRRPRGTIDLVLYDNVDFPNGFTTVYPSNRVAIFLTPPAGEIGLARYDDWLRLVITHELTHVFHLDRADGIWRVLQRVFGRAPELFPNAYRPSWVTEGLAVYYESKLTDGGRGRGGFHAQLLTAAAAGGRWPAPGEANYGSPKWPDGLTPYAWGSRFFAWESATHADSVVPRFVDATSARLWPLTISGPLRRASGVGLDSAWKGFRDHWRSQVGAAGSVPTIIARGLRSEPRPRLSPDGARLAYVVSDGKHRDHVVVRDLASGRDVASHYLTSEVELAWVGRDLVVAQLDFTSPVEIRSGLFQWAPGGAWRRAARRPRLTRPFAAPGGAMGAVRIGPDSAVLVRLDDEGGTATLPAPPATAWSRVALSPDGRRLAGARHAHGQWDIAVWQPDAPGEARQLTDDVALDDDPAWSPDGTAVVFTSERAGLPQIYAFRLEPAELWQLTDEPTGAREPALAADGTLYYSTLFADGYAVVSRPAGWREPAPAEPASPGGGGGPEPATARETAYRSWPSLLPRYWVPLVHDASTTGTFLGGFTSSDDVLGRVGYAAGLAHATQNGRAEGYGSLLYTRWSALSLDGGVEQLWDVGGYVPGPGGLRAPVAERDRSAFGGATLEWRRWRSRVFGRVGGELTQEAFFAPDSLRLRFPNPTFAGGVVTLGATYVNRSALSISVEDGIGVGARYRRRWELGGPGWSDELRGTLRGYLGLPLPGFARWVLAARITGAASGGPNAKLFALGGESEGALGLFPGVAVGGGTRDFPLRGYPANASRFTRVVASAGELRVPLFLIGKGVWKLPVSVDRISVSVFGELGGGWNASQPRRIAQYRDVGAELVSDLALNGDSSFRLRFGVARALAPGFGVMAGTSRSYLAFGSSF